MDSLDHVGAGECEAWLEALSRHDKDRDGGTKGDGGMEASDEEKQFWDRMTGHVSAVTDVPCAIFAKELLRCFPDAPVMLSIRSPAEDEVELPRYLHGAAAFAKSVHNTILETRRRVPWMKPGIMSDAFLWVMGLPPAMKVRREGLRILFGDDVCRGEPGREIEIAKGRYRQHNEEVVATCKGMGRKVLVFDCKDGWGPLLDFLNEGKEDGEVLEAPKDDMGNEIPFPRLNDTAMFHQIVGAKAKKTKAMISLKLQRFGTIAVSGALAAALAIWLARNRT